MIHTAEEIYQRVGREILSRSAMPDPMELIIKAINEARIEAIKECAEVATIQFHNYDNKGNHINIREMGFEINIDGSPESDYIIVSKQSILNLIHQIK